MKPITKVVTMAGAAGALALAIVPNAASASRQAAAKSPFHPAASQEVATLKSAHAVYSSPGGRKVWTVQHYGPITGSEAMTMPVLKTTTHHGGTWLQVLLPGREKPNQNPPKTGWIKATGTHTWQITWHIYVTVGPNTSGYSSRRRVWVYNHGKLVKDWLAVPGAPGRVTPTGQYFVEENIRTGNNTPGGPFALATSARSNTYREFDGGPGQVAIHGMADGLQAKPGTAVSHGCVRLVNSAITWLAHQIYWGTPVTIVK
jgi:lipoprotein-anchoring transpeptidase ErfK/SrfK